MGQVTRCPSCGTMFKVVADQLKVSGGWVRCGHCAEVFDARLNLQQDAQPSEPKHPQLSGVQLGIASETNPGPGFQPESQPESRPESQPETPPPAPPEPPDVLLEPTPHADAPAAVRVAVPSRAAPSAPWPSEIDGVSFMRQARRQAFWRQPSIRAGLGMLALLMLACLCLQIALDQRDRLAALEPRTKPWLEALCREFGCQLLPLRQLDALAIDGSSFNKMAPTLYRLSFAVKNGSTLEVAAPAIELTLTDAQDQTLARRVLQAAELGSIGAVIKPGAEWIGGALLRLTPSVGDVAGYRILAFYP